MKKVLGRKISATALALILLAGVVLAAAVVVFTLQYELTLQEPLVFSEADPLQLTFPGDSDTITVAIENKNTELAYGIIIDFDVTKGEDKITDVSYAGSADVSIVETETPSNDFNGDGDYYDAKAVITKGGSGAVDITVTTDPGAEAGSVTVVIDFIRTAAN